MSWIESFRTPGLQNYHGQKVSWVKTDLPIMIGARFAQRSQVRTNFLFPSLVLFANMSVGRRLLLPCRVFPKVHSTMLRIPNMLKMNCFMFPEVGKVCWIGLCKVWHMKAWRKSFSLRLFSTYFKRESQCLNMKAWRASYSSFKWKIVHRSSGMTILAGPWLK